jgi:hypothetical protein
MYIMYVYVRLSLIGFSHRRNDKAEIRVYGSYGRTFVPACRRIDLGRCLLRFDIGGIYWSVIYRYLWGIWALTGFGNLVRPYLILLSGHQLATAAALRYCSLEKDAQLEMR